MITVIGLGFVGLTTALGFSEKGNKVYGFDIDEHKTMQLKKGKIPFYEPFLDEQLKKHLNSYFLITDNLEEAIRNSEAIFLCVGTPSSSDGSAYLGYIFDAIKNAALYIEKSAFKVFVIKSTIPPSTTNTRIKPFLEELGFNVGEDIGLANNPEFLREGYAWEDFMNPDRVIIGQEDEKSGKILKDLYQNFHAEIFHVSCNTAEYIKYLSNTLLANLISFANEQSMIAKSIGGIDLKKAFNILHLDKRWQGDPASMTSYVFPGCGFGGYCLPKDTKALISMALQNSYSPDLLRSILTVNENIKEHVVRDIVENVEATEIIGILGLSFKPNSDDIRETPAKDVIQSLIQKGFKNIIAYDPIANENFKKTYQLPIDYSNDMESLLTKVNHLVILTAWNEFKDIKGKNVFDYRYILD